MKAAAGNALKALAAAKVEEQADDWLSQMKKHHGSGVSYLSSPSNAMTYNAAALTR